MLACQRPPGECGVGRPECISYRLLFQRSAKCQLPCPLPAPGMPVAARAVLLNALCVHHHCACLVQVNEVEIDGGRVGKGHGVLVKR